MTQYSKGRRAEYRARDELLADPRFHTVLRTAGSHGPCDLIAVGHDYNLFVEVKSTVKQRPDFSKELQALKDWPVPERDSKELRVWLRNRRTWVILPA